MPPKKIAALLALAALNFLSSFIFWLSTDLFFRDLMNLANALFFAAAFVLLLSCLSLGSFLYENLRQFLSLILPSSLVSVFLFPLSPVFLALPLLYFFASFIFFNNVRREKALYIKPNLSRLLQPHLGLLFLTLSFLVSLAHYGTTASATTTIKVQIPDEIFIQASDLAAKYFELNTPPAQNEMMGDIAQQLKSQTDQMIKPLKDELNKQLSALIEPYRPFLPVLFSLSFFLSLTFFGTMIKGLAVPVCFFAFAFFKKIGIISLKKETREVEVITFG